MITKEQRVALDELKKSEWWRVLKRLIDETITQDSKKMLESKDFDITSPETQQKLKDASDNLKTMKKIVDIVEVNTLFIVEPNLKWE